MIATRADPLAIIPIYSSDAIGDVERLVYCLVIHPCILEFVLYKLRQSAAARYAGMMQAIGKDPDEVNEDLLFKIQQLLFVVEAILVFNRRFMLRCVCCSAHTAHLFQT